VILKWAKGILSGKYKYCPECDDYYLSKSYLSEVETKETKICVYEDPINIIVAAMIMLMGMWDITYSICPKGYKHEISRNERRS